MFNRRHPECKDNEVFITNSDKEMFTTIGWKTKRKGLFSYDDEGKLLGNRWKNSFPVFVKKSEIAKRRPEYLKELVRIQFL